MDVGADAMPMPDRLRLPVDSRSPGAVTAAAHQGSVADETLVRHVAEGDAAALAALYRRYGARLFGFRQRYAGDRMVAEEILQDTLLAVWRSAHLYAGRLVASALAPLVAPEARVVGLIAAWLGPMTLLLALSQVLAMWIGPSWSMAAAGALWALRVVTVTTPGLAEGWLGAGVRTVWATSPGTVAAAGLLMLAAIGLSRRPGRPTGWPSRLSLR